MKRLALAFAALTAACDSTYVSPAPGPIVQAVDPCAGQLYQSPACDTNYNWTPGYYNPMHVWIGPRYVRRTVIVHSPPVIVTRPPVYRTPAVIPSYRAPVTTTTTVRSSSAFRPRATTTVTTTRRYR